MAYLALGVHPQMILTEKIRERNKGMHLWEQKDSYDIHLLTKNELGEDHGTLGRSEKELLHVAGS